MIDCVPALTPSEQKQVASTWLDRARAEEIAVLRFQRLANELRECGTHPAVLELAEKAIPEEKEHAILCLNMAQKYGADHTHEANPAQAGPLAPASLNRTDALLYEMVAYCCLTESLNAALLLETAQKATNRAIQSAAQKILKDEVHHSQMGWAHLSWCRAQGLGDFLADVLPHMLDQTGAEEFSTNPTKNQESENLMAHGELPLLERKKLFDRIVRQVFLPGLSHAKIAPDLGHAWMDEKFILKES